MFEVMDRFTGERFSVYGVHRSGDEAHETKFLVFNQSWEWVWVTRFEPVTQLESREVARPILRVLQAA